MSATATPAPTAPASGPRRARLSVSRIDPWTVLKTSFVLSLGLAVIVVVATMLLWVLLSISGTFESFDQTLSDLGGSGAGGVDVGNVLSFGRVMGFALLMGAFEIVMTSALATVITMIYNLTVSFTGGIEVTLSEH